MNKKRFTVFISYLLVLVLAITSFTACGAEVTVEDKLEKAEKYLEDEKYDKAIELLEEVLEEDPKNRDAYFSLVDAYVGNDDYKAALKVLNKAAKKLENEAIDLVRDNFEEKMDESKHFKWNTASAFKEAKKEVGGGFFGANENNKADESTHVGVTVAPDENASENETENTAAVESSTTVEVEPEEPQIAINKYTGEPLITDKYGNVVDLGGIDVVVASWWTDEINNEYEEARYDYLQYLQKEYNFTLRQEAVTGYDDYDSLEEYVYSNGRKGYYAGGVDLSNLVVVMPNSSSLLKAYKEGLLYNLKTLDCLDFSEEKWCGNFFDDFTTANSAYMMNPFGPGELYGLFFNKRILKAAGIDPNYIYTLQESGDWTWDRFLEICNKTLVDYDGDGYPDQFALSTYEPDLYEALTYSNQGSYIEYVNGQFTFTMDSPNTLEALDLALALAESYNVYQPEDTEWTYAMDAFANGYGAFCFGPIYYASNYFWYMDDDYGFVCCPKGYKASDYQIPIYSNAYVIPACYDAEQAWKIAFAFNLWSEPVPGYEDKKDIIWYAKSLLNDESAITSTIPTMLKSDTVLPVFQMVAGIDKYYDFYDTLNSYSNPPINAAALAKQRWQDAIDKANSR